jgi:hypothetical protein
MAKVPWSPFPCDFQRNANSKGCKDDPGCEVQATLKRTTRIERWSADNATSEKQKRRVHTQYQRNNGTDEVTDFHGASDS